MDLMGLSQADSARRLNVCHSIVQKLSDQFETKNSVTRGRPRIKIPAQDRFLALLVRRRRNTTVAQIILDHRTVTRMTISATIGGRQTTKDSIQDVLLCLSLLIDDTEVPLYVVQESTLARSDSNGLLYSSQMNIGLV